MPKANKSRALKWSRSRTPIVLGGLVALFLVLSVPASQPAIPVASEASPFVWNQDSVWTGLESAFLLARSTGCDALEPEIRADLRMLNDALGVIETRQATPEDSAWSSVETTLFSLGARIAACPGHAPEFVRSATELRRIAKQASISWDLGEPIARRRLYRLLYGGRAAIEEVLAQQADSTLALTHGTDEQSKTPSAVVQGVRIHSGDLLVSRGGYPTSALISRGSDYPGNFSHVALAHVSETGEVSVIEAHIEVGVAVSRAEQYLADKKLRLMVLRPRHDLDAIVEDPLLPHRAASYMLDRAREEHIPYDFAMDYRDPSHLFCSEVASAAYGQYGITLWTGISTISTPGLRDWLGSFGVKHFETQEPSDLEYDPQLVVVAEWRDPSTLQMDRTDNAVVDALLETAEEGARLSYPWYELALTRVAKGYSVALGAIGGVGPVPEGMSATAALKNRHYTLRHDHLSAVVSRRADQFASDEQYEPPYWRLLDMARAVVAEE